MDVVVLFFNNYREHRNALRKYNGGILMLKMAVDVANH
jgi:hypothetical protein